MVENNENNKKVDTPENSKENINVVTLNGLFLFKEGMSTWFNSELGQSEPVTILRFESHVVSLVRTYKNGYGVQVAVGSKKLKTAKKSIMGHLKKAQVYNPSKFLKELRCDSLKEIPKIGDRVGLHSLKTGDIVQVIGVSKGKGFAGSVKRFGFGGGPASHGSGFHRQPGSSGNRTWPGRVMPGKKFPGHLGQKTVHVKNLKVLHVDEINNVILIRGCVPGARNSLVTVVRS